MSLGIDQLTQRGSLAALLHPRGQLRLILAMLGIGLLVGWVGMSRLSLPLWGATVVGIALLVVPAARKWQLDRKHLGTPAMILSVLLVTQGLHTVEHIAQWVQYYMLGWPLKAASGLISPLNAEVVHFGWNTAVLLTVIALLCAGMRNRWMWFLVIWAGAHTAEHTYMFFNYLETAQELAAQNAPLSAAQGLPGFFGRGGWLATNLPAAGPIAFFCTIAGGLTTAPRLDVHFWWNIGEVFLLLPAAHVSMRRHAQRLA